MTEEKPKRRFNLRTIGIIAIALVVLCVICVGVVSLLPDTEPAATEEVAQAPAEAEQEEAAPAEPSDTPPPTDIPAPTDTPAPTNTPEPTDTPVPTPTPTQPPEPIILEGQGDSVVNVDKWDGPAVLHFSSSGSGNTAVWNYDSAGEQIDLLVNEIGAYEGKLPIDFLDSEETTRLSIETNGNWRAEIYPLVPEYLTIMEIPSTYEGDGDDVVFLGGTPDLANFKADNASGNFAVWAFGNAIDMLVNEIAPYSGTVIVPRSTIVLQITARGSWSMEITAP